MNTLMERDKVAISDVRTFFDLPISKFASEWKQLTEEDKAQIRQGIDDGSLTY